MNYARLGKELWRIPATRYFLAGVALASLIPVTLKGLHKYRTEKSFNEFKDALSEKLNRPPEQEYSDVLG